MIFVPFNGNSLIFIVWLFMIFKPFVKTINCNWGGVEFNTGELSDSKQNFEAILKEKRMKMKNDGGTHDTKTNV